MSQPLEFIASVHRGYIVPPKLYARYMQAQEGKELRIKASFNTKKRSEKQNDYVWAMIEKYVLPAYLESDLKWDKESVYDDVVKQLGYVDHIKRPDGSVKIVRQRTSKFDTPQYSELMERFWAYCAQNMGLYIPSPGEWAEGNR